LCLGITSLFPSSKSQGIKMVEQGKYGIFHKAEDRATELMLGEKKTAVETAEILKLEGHVYTPVQLRRIKEKAFDSLMNEERSEMMSDFLLDSIKKVTFKFEGVYDKFEKIYDKFELEGNTFTQLIVLRDLKDMLHMSIKKLGEYTHGLERIQAKNVNVYNNSQVLVAVNENQNKWFESMEPEVKEGKLVFNKPLPEVLDAYNRWKFTTGKSKVL